MSDDLTGVEMTLRWWVLPYLSVLYWCAALMGKRPRDAHVEWILAKGANWTRV